MGAVSSSLVRRDVECAVRQQCRGWMQTVGAQWLMLTLTGSATYVALVQTAASLPVILFAVAAGVPLLVADAG